MPFCRVCGAEVSEGVKFCPSCGASITPRERFERREKGEKAEKREKGEKREKAEKGEKAEKREVEASVAIVAGAILILMGITIYIALEEQIAWREMWGYFVFGVGCILLVLAILRYATTSLRGSAIAPLVIGVILCALGIGGVLEVREWWPYILMAVGVIIIVAGWAAARRSPRP